MKFIISGAVIISSSLLSVVFISFISAFESSAECLCNLKNCEGHKLSRFQRFANKQQITGYCANLKNTFNILPLQKRKNRQAFDSIIENLEFLFQKYKIATPDIANGILRLQDTQKRHIKYETTKNKNKDGVYDYLSGVPITVETKFFNLNFEHNLKLFQDLIYFFEYAAASYGGSENIQLSCPCFNQISGLK